MNVTITGTLRADGEIKAKQPCFIPGMLFPSSEPFVAVDLDGRPWRISPNAGTYRELVAG